MLRIPSMSSIAQLLRWNTRRMYANIFLLLYNGRKEISHALKTPVLSSTLGGVDEAITYGIQ